MSISPVLQHAVPPLGASDRMYRLTDGHGRPHPVLDELFDCLDAAHEAALEWIEQQALVPSEAPAGERHALLRLHFGIEVSTRSGDWRTLRHAGWTGCAPTAC
ncbi:MAG: hypothetical protein RLZZ219_403 [Cyanobacteriota bacterium]|jgi:hypothetical protein